MGEFRDGQWIPDGRGPHHDRLHAAKRAMRLAHRSDRPIEAAGGDGRDPAHRAARQFAALTHSVDPDEISAKDISAVLEHQRQSLGHDDKSSASATSALNAQLVDELAEDTDDNIEDITARSDDGSADDYEDEDEDAHRFDWLEDTYDLTADELAEALQELDPDDAQAAVTGLEELYRLHRQGYGTEAAEQIYLAQLDSGDAESAETYSDHGDGLE